MTKTKSQTLMTGEHSVTIFEIDESCFENVIIRKEWGMYDHLTTPLTDEQLLVVLRGNDRCSSTHSEDHPEFARLRDRLEAEGYIRTCRQSWNGDTVLKTFILNRVEFTPGERFRSACAIKWDIDHKEKVI